VSLEEFNPETKRATKTAIFERRTLERYRPLERAKPQAEALLVSLNETGRISWPRMESLTGRSASELQTNLDLSPTEIPRVELGNCGPLPQRQRARETCRCAGFQSKSIQLIAGMWKLSGRAAEGPGTGRDRSAPRLVVDSAFGCS